MRRVVRGEHQRALLHRAAQLRAVLGGAERRGHLVVRIVAGDLVAREQEVVGRRLGRDGKPLPLRRADELHALRGGEVLDVEPAARDAAEREIAADRRRLGGDGDRRQTMRPREGAVADHAAAGLLRIHRVLADAHPELRGAAHRLLHHGVVRDVGAVVGEERGPGPGEGLEVRDLAAEPSLRDAGGRKEDRLRSGRARGEALVFDALRRVAGRVGVRHRDDGGETAAPGRGEPAGRRLRLGRARIAEVHVHVHEAGECHFRRSIHG